ncbi:MAG: hypothetical protein IPH37_14225 [Burkholderiales bacterium]|nr:hypothetical protein [Burkholderiales bacterium]
MQSPLTPECDESFETTVPVFFIARIEAGFLVRFRRFALATLAVACIPALYAVIYLSSVWDPSAHTNALAVAMVNLDKGVSFHDNEFNIGNEVIQNSKSHRPLGTVTSPTRMRPCPRCGKANWPLRW